MSLRLTMNKKGHWRSKIFIWFSFTMIERSLYSRQNIKYIRYFNITFNQTKSTRHTCYTKKKYTNIPQIFKLVRVGGRSRSIIRIVIRIRVRVVRLILPEQVAPGRPRVGHRHVPAPHRQGGLVPGEGVEARGWNGRVEWWRQSIALSRNVVEKNPLHVVVVTTDPGHVPVGLNQTNGVIVEDVATVHVLLELFVALLAAVLAFLRFAVFLGLGAALVVG